MHWTGLDCTGEVRVIELHIAKTRIVEFLQLRLIRRRDILKVLLVGRIHVLGVRQPFPVAQMVPVGRSKSKLDVLHLVRGHDALDKAELADVGAADVADLARADDRLGRFGFFFHKRRGVRQVRAKHFRAGVLDLGHAFEIRPERAPEH